MFKPSIWFFSVPLKSHDNYFHVCLIDLVSHCKEGPRRVHWSQVQRGTHWHVSSHQHLWGPGLHRCWPLCMERVTKEPNIWLLFHFNVFCMMQRYCCLWSVQFWVCLQLPVAGQPESQLGGGKEGGHDGATAGGPQICHSPGHPQGESAVLPIRKTHIVTYICKVLCYSLSSHCMSDVGGAGEEPCQPAVHHSHSGDARWWDDLAGAGGAVLWTSPRCKHICFTQSLWAHSSLMYTGNIFV